MTDRDRMMPVYGVKVELDFGLTVNNLITVRQKRKKASHKAVNNAPTERKPGDAFNFVE